MSTLSYYTPKDWTFVAEVDESGYYEVDVAEVYVSGDKVILATASGCSCWDGDYDTEEFESVDALAASLLADDRKWNPSPAGALYLVEQTRAHFGRPAAQA